MRLFTALALSFLTAGSAAAMGPDLTPTPIPATLLSCQRWAASQDDDARTMFGLMENGNTSADLGISRLTSVCLGDEVPEIVGVGASAGAAQQFCKSHRGTALCRGMR